MKTVSRKAFTLLELVVAMVIFAILSALTIPVFVQLATGLAKGRAGATATTTLAHTTTTLAKGGGKLAGGQMGAALSSAMGVIFIVGACLIGLAFVVGLIKFVARGGQRSSRSRDTDEMHTRLSELKRAHTPAAYGNDSMGGASMGTGSSTHQAAMVSGGQGLHQVGEATLSGLSSTQRGDGGMITSSLGTMAPDPAHSGAVVTLEDSSRGGALATLDEPAPLVHEFVGPVTKKNRRGRNSERPKFR
jgi:prepilin-type N-terminal cleavage/methylation domain-containing protein